MDNYIDILLKEAKKSLKTDDVPVGAIIVENSKIISRGHNTREKKHKITGHAEINAIEKASKKKKTWHLDNCELYVTLKPCKMCTEIIKESRIKKVYYILENEKEQKEKNINFIKIKNVENTRKMLKDFFKNKRK